MKHILLFLCIQALLGARAQNTIGEILKSIETNSKELEAGRQLLRSDKLAARTGNSLPDPTVTYEYLAGSPAELGKTGELTISQSFDFPTVYINRNKLAETEGLRLDHQYASIRRDVLLKAQELCLDLIYLNQQRELLDLRLKSAEQLSALYRQKLQTGDANILETNKIDLELLNIRTESQTNETTRLNVLRDLMALNGNQALSFSGTVYPATENMPAFEELKTAALAADPLVQSAKTEQTIARRQISLNKSLWFPKFELGYRHNTGPGEQFNGFVAGISIPLYENRNTIKQAKARKIYTETQMENLVIQAETELKNLYEQALALQASLREYQRVLQTQNNLVLLSKALDAGQLSMIEYFIEANTVYQSMQNYILLENQYQKTMARIYKFNL